MVTRTQRQELMIVRIFSDYLCPWCNIAAARLHHLQEEYKERITKQWHSFLLFRQDVPKGESAVARPPSAAI